MSSFLYRLTFLRTIALAAIALAWLNAVFASSAPPRPLKRLAHPSVLALEILPRRSSNPLSPRSLYEDNSPILRHTDSLRLTVSAFSQQFHLHLRPNDQLIHHSARINYYRTPDDGVGPPIKYKTEPLLRESVNAYWGEVVRAESSSRRISEDIAGGLLMQNENMNLGWARIVVHDQGDEERGIPPSFEGAFEVRGVVHHVATRENYMLRRHPLDPLPFEAEDGVEDLDGSLVIFRDSDVMNADEELAFGRERRGPRLAAREAGADRVCSHDALPFNVEPSLNPVLRMPTVQTPFWLDPFGVSDPWWNDSLQRRDDVAGGTGSNNFSAYIGVTTGCAQTQKIVYMGVAADCQYTNLVGSTQNATRAILTNWNTASALYKRTFNVSLGIVEIDMNDGTCPTVADPTKAWNIPCGSATLNERLSLFSAWRGQKGDDGTGLWHLMSGCPTGTEVGVAWLGTLCQTGSSGVDPMVVSSTAVSTFGRTEWQVVAHEIGHNFGAIHDCADGCPSNITCCPFTLSSCDASGAFLMSPTSSSTESAFSQCTIGNICSVLGTTPSMASCLQDPNPLKQTITLNMCGNGIVEAGEECDPGIGTTSPCCDSATCQFTAGSVCDFTNSACCSQQCSFSPAGTLCQAAANAICDKPEYCTGTGPECPADVTAPNGLSCGPDGLMCAQGQCTSPDQQCQIVGGSLGLSKACPQQNDMTCQIACQDPTQANQCVVLQALMVDGSPCGYGGSCLGGVCTPGSFLQTAKAWYTQNLQYSVPATIVVVIVVCILCYGLFLFIRRNCYGGKWRRSIRRNAFKPQLFNAPSSKETYLQFPPEPRRPPLIQISSSSSASTIVALGGPDVPKTLPKVMFDGSSRPTSKSSRLTSDSSAAASSVGKFTSDDVSGSKRASMVDATGPRLPPLAFGQHSGLLSAGFGEGFGEGLLGIPSMLRPGGGLASSTPSPAADMRSLTFGGASPVPPSTPGPKPVQYRVASPLLPQDRTPYPGYLPQAAEGSGAPSSENQRQAFGQR